MYTPPCNHELCIQTWGGGGVPSLGPVMMTSSWSSMVPLQCMVKGIDMSSMIMVTSKAVSGKNSSIMVLHGAVAAHGEGCQFH
eukprot:1161200-Pelagomonas_calceolata.AAC.11